MNKLEEQFTKDVLAKLEVAAQKCGYNSERFIKHTSKFGLVQWAKQAARRGQISDGFEQLHKAGLLELTVEASIVDSKYAELFDDDEVNYFFELLSEYGYYNWISKN